MLKGINFSRIFRDGMAHAQAGGMSSGNPYTILTPKWWHWLDGFNAQSALLRRKAV